MLEKGRLAPCARVHAGAFLCNRLAAAPALARSQQPTQPTTTDAPSLAQAAQTSRTSNEARTNPLHQPLAPINPLHQPLRQPTPCTNLRTQQTSCTNPLHQPTPPPGNQYSVKQFVELSCELLGMGVRWEGEGAEAKGIDAETGKVGWGRLGGAGGRGGRAARRSDAALGGFRQRVASRACAPAAPSPFFCMRRRPPPLCQAVCLARLRGLAPFGFRV